ncbi:MAG: hypothetical protein ACXVB5_14525 [Isosphaeraceae bacterium]
MQSALQAVQALQATGDHHREFVGHSGRRRRKKIVVLGLTASDILKEAGLTISFDPQNEVRENTGLRNIWQRIAYTYPVKVAPYGLARINNPTIMQRAESARYRAMDIRTAFKSLRGLMEEEHGDRFPLYMVRRMASSSLIEVITLDPDYEVYEGMTARQAYAEWNIKYSTESVRSSMKRAFTYTGDKRDFAQALQKTIWTAYREITVQPKLALTFDDEADA